MTVSMVIGKRKPETVMGHTLPEPGLTPAAFWLIGSRIVLPILVIGSILDLLAQLLFGICTGLWCFVADETAAAGG